MRHPFESADRICAGCGGWYCDGCLVSPWGPRKGALCVSCAIEWGGVRRTAGQRPMRSPREIRQLERERRKQARSGPHRPVLVERTAFDVPGDEETAPRWRPFRR